MKKILLLFVILFIGNFVYAQIPDIVQQTWYLRNVQLDGTHNYVPYQKTIELNFAGINPDYSVSTNGIANTLTANVNFDNTDITFSNIEVSLLDCTDPDCYFENGFYLSRQCSFFTLSNQIFNYQ